MIDFVYLAAILKFKGARMERKFFVVAGFVTTLLFLALAYHVALLPDRSSQAAASEISTQAQKNIAVPAKANTHADQVIKLVSLAEMLPAYPLSGTEKKATVQWGIKSLKNLLPWEGQAKLDHPVQAVLLGFQTEGQEFIPEEVVFFVGKNVGAFSGERWQLLANGNDGNPLKAKLISDLDQDNDGLMDLDTMKNAPSPGHHHRSTESFAFAQVLAHLQSSPEMQKHLSHHYSGKISTAELNKILFPLVAKSKKEAELAWEKRPNWKITMEAN